MSRIEQLIDEIEEFVESCKPQPFSQSKIIVPKDEFFELLTELRLKTPDEIKRYQKIIANKDKIIGDAQAQAERMLKAEELVDKSLYNAYAKSIVDFSTDYNLAIAQFLSDNGIEPCTDTINTLIASVGKKTNSARNMCKTGKHNGTFSFKQWRKIFLGELCDLMGDALPIYKFAYVLKDKRTDK